MLFRSPQLLLLRNRVKVEELVINMTTYNLRKQRFEQRVKEMTLYIKEEKKCRSQIIGNYFGDHALKPCGVCDNCLRQKASVLSKDEFDAIHTHILNIIKKEPVQIKDLMLKLNSIKKEKAWKVIEFLQAENKINMDETGWISIST